MKISGSILFGLILIISATMQFENGIDVDGMDLQIGTTDLVGEGIDIGNGEGSVYFTENAGQWDEKIEFMASVDFGQVALSQRSIYYNIAPVMENETVSGVDQGSVIRMDFVNSSSNSPVGIDKLSMYSNYFLGN